MAFFVLCQIISVTYGFEKKKFKSFCSNFNRLNKFMEEGQKEKEKNIKPNPNLSI